MHYLHKECITHSFYLIVVFFSLLYTSFFSSPLPTSASPHLTPQTAYFKILVLWRNGNPLALLVGMQIGAATLENSVEVPQKIKNRSPL